MKRTVPLLALLLSLFAVSPLLADETDTIPAPQTKGQRLLNAVGERLKFSGFFQAGYTGVMNGDIPLSKMRAGDNTFAVNRLCFTVRANLAKGLDVVYQGDFSYSFNMLDFYATYELNPAFVLSFGQQKTPLTIENQLPPFFAETISLGSPITNFLTSADPSNPLNGVQTGRDIGFMVRGDLFKSLIGYKIGLFNGQGINSRDLDKNKALSGSLSLRPLKGLELQGSFWTGAMTAKGSAAFTAGERHVEAGQSFTRDRWSAGAAYSSSAWSLRGEYVWGKDDAVVSDGFYLTGRARLYKGLEAVLSYTRADYNRGGIDPLTADYFIAGLQYWFLPKCRLQVEYNLNAPHDRALSHAIQAQLQFAF